jgi:hypothetical protein
MNKLFVYTYIILVSPMYLVGALWWTLFELPFVAGRIRAVKFFDKIKWR